MTVWREQNMKFTVTSGVGVTEVVDRPESESRQPGYTTCASPTPTIMVIEFRKWSGQSFGIVGGSRRAADSS
jgi:hypothetical protein